MTGTDMASITVEAPKWPVWGCTTAELARYRERLEQAMQGLACGPAHEELAGRLREVAAEQDARRQAELRSLGSNDRERS